MHTHTAETPHDFDIQWLLTFIWLDWYLNFCAWFMENILFEQEINL